MAAKISYSVSGDQLVDGADTAKKTEKMRGVGEEGERG